MNVKPLSAEEVRRGLEELMRCTQRDGYILDYEAAAVEWTRANILRLFATLDAERAEAEMYRQRAEEDFWPFEWKVASEMKDQRDAIRAERDAARAACEGCWLAISHRCACPALVAINEEDRTDAASLARGMDAAIPGSTEADTAAGMPQAGQDECARADIGEDCRCRECVERRAANDERAAEWAEDAQGEERP